MDSRHTPLHEFQQLMDHEVVKNQKINCIKLLRQITGEGLKETKDFFEDVWQPFILNCSGKKKSLFNQEPMPDDTYNELLKRVDALTRDVRELKAAQTQNRAKTLFTEED